MNNRTVTVGVLAAVLIVAAWWMFLFSPARSDASKVDTEVKAAKAKSLSLETEKKQLEDLEKRAPEIEADRDRLRNAVPDQPDLATFIEQANQLGVDTGVTWVSVSPTEPAAGTAAGTIQVALQVTGGYYQVLDYLNRLESIPRLVVVDQVSLTASDASAAGGAAAVGGPPQLAASLTARMFDSAAAASSAVSPDGSTTPTTVAGGGGVAAPQGQGS
jgi:Tfp pilus assembly protein PilO